MKPYEFINHIIDDIISQYLEDDYCFRYFHDLIRYDHNYNEAPEDCIQDKSLVPGIFEEDQDLSKKQNLPQNLFYHNQKWLSTKNINTDLEGTLLRDKVKYRFYNHSFEPVYVNYDKHFYNYIQEKKFIEHTNVIVHSEVNSRELDQLQCMGIKHLYWFSHAYLCSEFYFKHYKKLRMVTDYKVRPIEYPWICANRLLRDYRVEFLHSIDYTKGAYSLLPEDATGKKLWGTVPPNSFDDHGNDSAEICVDRLTPWNTSFLHCVMETVWQDKIHFTEKVFKPIVLHQPFVVLQAPGSLEYLRGYGFKTFGDWWDEGYDTIQNPNERMQAIADIVNWISTQDLYKMREEMSGVLEYNFRHFYENIPDIVLDELRVNLRNAV